MKVSLSEENGSYLVDPTPPGFKLLDLKRRAAAKL
jgi:hypothetical protein